MEERLKRLYLESLNELSSIGINFNNKIISIGFSKRNNKRYGCCKIENNVYYIEISKWVMELDDKLVKNTIIHELIHCIPGCNNHGEKFKFYAKKINDKLGYSVSRVGNKKEDFEKCNLEFKEDLSYKYKIICSLCGQVYYRKRMAKNFIRKYRCGKCKGKLIITI